MGLLAIWPWRAQRATLDAVAQSTIRAVDSMAEPAAWVPAVGQAGITNNKKDSPPLVGLNPDFPIFLEFSGPKAGRREKRSDEAEE